LGWGGGLRSRGEVKREEKKLGDLLFLGRKRGQACGNIFLNTEKSLGNPSKI